MCSPARSADTTLARLGAEVIKVENPNGGDLARRLRRRRGYGETAAGLSFVAVNAGRAIDRD